MRVEAKKKNENHADLWHLQKNISSIKINFSMKTINIYIFQLLEKTTTFYVIWDCVYVVVPFPKFMPGSWSWWEGSLTASCKAACVICHTFFSYSYLFISLFWNATSTPLHTLWVKSRDLSLTRRVAAMNCMLHPLDKSSQFLVINSGGHGMYSFWREISSFSLALRHASTQQWVNTSWGRAIYLGWPRGVWQICSPPTA